MKEKSNCKRGKTLPTRVHKHYVATIVEKRWILHGTSVLRDKSLLNNWLLGDGMSVDISIDRRQLLEALLKPYNIVLFTRFSFGNPESTDLYYKDGWIFVDFKGAGFPAITHGKVHVDLQMNGTDGSVMMVYIHELKKYYLHFFETEKAEYDTYLGTHLLDDGSVVYVNMPEDKSQTLLPPGSINPGDTLLSGLYIANRGGDKIVKIMIRRVDFTKRRFVNLVDFEDRIGYGFHVVSAYGLEPWGTPCRFGIAFAVTGPIQYYHDIAPWLLKYGLPDPKEINPWR
ncbi:MAG: hypothetical protein QW794_05065 [Thermosphaera sp.]